MGARERRKGHNFECYLMNRLRHVFASIVSARSESRNKDSKGFDFINTGPFAIQAKSYSAAPNYHRLITQMDTSDIPVVVHQKTEKAGKSGRFMVRGEYAILRLDDFITLIESKCQNGPSEEKEKGINR